MIWKTPVVAKASCLGSSDNRVTSSQPITWQLGLCLWQGRWCLLRSASHSHISFGENHFFPTLKYFSYLTIYLHPSSSRRDLKKLGYIHTYQFSCFLQNKETRKWCGSRKWQLCKLGGKRRRVKINVYSARYKNPLHIFITPCEVSTSLFICLLVYFLSCAFVFGFLELADIS